MFTIDLFSTIINNLVHYITTIGNTGSGNLVKAPNLCRKPITRMQGKGTRRDISRPSSAIRFSFLDSMNRIVSRDHAEPESMDLVGVDP
jgi:hypothetical protein